MNDKIFDVLGDLGSLPFLNFICYYAMYLVPAGIIFIAAKSLFNLKQFDWFTVMLPILIIILCANCIRVLHLIEKKLIEKYEESFKLRRELINLKKELSKYEEKTK